MRSRNDEASASMARRAGYGERATARICSATTMASSVIDIASGPTQAPSSRRSSGASANAPNRTTASRRIRRKTTAT